MPPPAAVCIAPMEAADIDAVAAIDLASFQAAQLTVERLQEELERPWTRMWVARDAAVEAAPHSRVVAFVVTWHVTDELHVLNVATLPSRRREGIARLLMEHVLAWSHEKAVRHVLLEVRRSNVAALRLYRALEFAAVRVRRGYYPDGEDAVEMSLTFDPATRAVVKRTDEVFLDPGDAR